MPTPTAVTNAARDADELIRSLSQQDAGDDPNASENEETGDTADGTDAVGEVEAQEEQVDQGVQAQPVSSDQPPQAPDDAEKRAQLWEQRYRSLNGMIESRDRQIESLHQLLANLQETQRQQAAPAQPERKKPLISDEDKDEYGEGLIDLARRVAQTEMADRESQLIGRIQELESQVSGVSQQQVSTSQERFLDNLRRRIPNLDRANQDPEFIRWLGASPTRQRMFNEAVQAMDLDGTAWFFEAWASPEETQTSAERAPKPPQSTDQRLERQVAPGKSRSVPTPAQRSEGAKRQWTRSAIVQFYKNMASYPQQDRDRIERDIAQAQKEGRVDFTK